MPVPRRVALALALLHVGGCVALCAPRLGAPCKPGDRFCEEQGLLCTAFTDVDGGNERAICLHAPVVGVDAGAPVDAGPPPACAVLPQPPADLDVTCTGPGQEAPLEGCVPAPAGIVVVRAGDTVCVDVGDQCVGGACVIECVSAFGQPGLALSSPDGQHVVVDTSQVDPGNDSFYGYVRHRNGELFLSIARPVLTGEHVWGGSEGRDVDVAANWEDATVPLPSDTIFVPANVPNVPLLDGALAVDSVVVATGALIEIDESASLTFRNDAFGYFVGQGLVLAAPVGAPAHVGGYFKELELGSAGAVRVDADLITEVMTTSGAALRVGGHFVQARSLLVDGSGIIDYALDEGVVGALGIIEDLRLESTEPSRLGPGDIFYLLGDVKIDEGAAEFDPSSIVRATFPPGVGVGIGANLDVAADLGIFVVGARQSAQLARSDGEDLHVRTVIVEEGGRLEVPGVVHADTLVNFGEIQGNGSIDVACWCGPAGVGRSEVAVTCP